MFGAMGNEWVERCDGLCCRLDALTEALNSFPRTDQQHAKDYREWQRFVLTDGGSATAGGSLTVGGSGGNLRPSSTGWEAYITSIAITASGASSGGTVTVYNGDLGDGNLVDYANQLFGSSPSRLVSFYDQETFWVEPNDVIVIVLASLAASSSVTVRVSGKRRQL